MKKRKRLILMQLILKNKVKNKSCTITVKSSVTLVLTTIRKKKFEST